MLGILTWNICFSSKLQELRYVKILSQTKSLNADIYCFQECIPEFVGLMAGDNFWFDNYDFSDLDFVSSGYGTIILAKKYLEFNFKSFDLTSQMGRKLVVGTNLDLTVGSVHLESLNSRNTRATQLEEIADLLKSFGSPNTVFCGDFNFCSKSNYSDPQTPLENSNLVNFFPDYKDLQTEPTWANTKGSFRFDRILLKSKYLKPHSIQLLGTNPIPGYVSTYPSDHKGLFVSMKII
jgi:endonuclease/exonuclease/phosphatase family metal-dependent hydrolase